jgi:uncharacterized integral membrane protein (TIGR00697 family)
MRNYKYLGFITVLYATFAVMSNVGAGKIVGLGSFVVSASVFFFPFTYIFADIVTEVYGYAKARTVAWQMLLVYGIAGAMSQIIVWLPAVAGFTASDAFTIVLGSVPRILFATFVAVWVGSIVNDYVLAKMKVWTNGKWLWTRTIGSTIVGEGVNTLLFYGIGLYGIIPGNLFWVAILSGWFLKVVVEMVMTPVTYVVVAKLKKLENEDYYDRETNFNPFIIESPKT